MTSDEFRAIIWRLSRFGLTSARVATLVGYRGHKSLTQMADGLQAVPEPLAAWLRDADAWFAAHPPPRVNRRRER